MKQILFITLSNIGDAVMTTPTLERLHQLFPNALIDLVCDARSEILFEHCPYRGEIFLKDKKQGKKGLFKLIRQLRKKRYDLIVDLRTDGLAYLLRAKKRLTKFGHQPYGPHAVEDLISIIDKINPEKQIPPTRIW
ncbi:MAG: glycosyltransferase family 9 protein, partial [Gammaproteobacteria bacterium]|nr:glycosyltransferase family 9 protein [Gammaproteobacteria bacterium]